MICWVTLLYINFIYYLHNALCFRPAFPATSIAFGQSILGTMLALPETISFRLSVSSGNSIPKRHVLTIVVVEIQVVHGVACRAIHHSRVGQILGIIWD